AQHAMVLALTARQVHGGAAAGDVGGGTHGGPGGGAGDQVVDHGAVAHGPDGRVVGLAVEVGEQGALHHVQATVGEPGGVGPDAGGQHHQVGLHLPVLAQHLLHLALAGDGGNPLAGKGHDARVGQVVLGP